ncbi:MAG: PAS domain-containing protein [Methanoregulaceae archaeon]|nr:PAS domain-containing protein [Methanoregulaceae archaeon]
MPESDLNSRIKRLLRANPRGLTITDIASKLKLNRNSVAKYLEILLVSGHVESRSFGTAKVYFLTHRIPISHMLSISPDLVIALDENRRVVYVNDHFLIFFEITRENTIGNHIVDIMSPGLLKSTLAVLLQHNIADNETAREVQFERLAGTSTFKVKGIPTVFDDGGRGVTFILEDVTVEKRYLESREFLSRNATALVEMGDDDDIFQFIAARVNELVPGSVTGVCSFDDDSRKLTLRAVAGDHTSLGAFEEGIKSALIGSEFPVDDTPQLARNISKSELVTGLTLFDLMCRKFPEMDCLQIEKSLSLTRSYTMGLVCRGGVYGDLVFGTRDDLDEMNRETIEAFIRQAAVALQRRHTKKKLRETDALVDGILEACGDAMIVLTGDGRILRTNEAARSLVRTKDGVLEGMNLGDVLPDLSKSTIRDMLALPRSKDRTKQEEIKVEIPGRGLFSIQFKDVAPTDDPPVVIATLR